ncbi:MAG: hypothetical protein SFV51_14740 [Bryobacteraceae bacterium]|nr:hypothetical protein [Bryobacteraceae bacterium]
MKTIPLHFAVLLMGCAFAQPFRPEIPRTWDEEAMRTLEVPLATPEVSPRHMPAERYYAIPEYTVYKTYPRHIPGRNDAEYFAWLREQEPVVILADLPRVRTKADWIEAGEAVFHWPSSIRQVEGAGESNRLVVRAKGKIEYGSAGCSFCHTRVLDDGTEIAGAQMNMARSWRERRPPTERDLAGFLASRTTGDLDAPWLKPDPNLVPPTLPLAIFASLRTRPPGPGPRFHTSLWSPVNMPSLIGVADIRYLDRTGHVRHRDIGDLMRYAALNFGIGTIAFTSAFGPSEPGRPLRPDVRRLSDAHLYALGLYIYSLQPPKNPNPFNAAAAQGQKIFAREGCTGCHPAPLYTNNKLTPAPGFRGPEEHKHAYDVLPVSVGTDPWLAMKTRRGTGYYKVPSLRGVWYRGPFEHNGSVLTLEDWFDPARLRDDYVPTGWLGPNATRAVRGHEFGLRLKPEERKALIAFLRTL